MNHPVSDTLTVNRTKRWAVKQRRFMYLQDEEEIPEDM